uniref:Uncharacterized protein n=1 Tax=Trichuris muris TaxID=70415 RepID=A0A5S6Q2I4_TRIMR
MACGANPTTSVELIAFVDSSGSPKQQQQQQQWASKSISDKPVVLKSLEQSRNTGYCGEYSADGNSSLHFSVDSLPKKSTTFKLEPEYIPGPKTPGDGASDASKQHRDRTRAKIRKIVCVVGVSLTVICIVLVAISFALGQEIDRMVTSKQNSPRFLENSPFAGNFSAAV